MGIIPYHINGKYPITLLFMPRPKLYRKIGFNPSITLYKPQGVPARAIEYVDLSLDELEAIRLKDLKDLDVIEGAKKMKISKSTFQRLYVSAHKKIASALINGKGIQIHKQIDLNFPGVIYRGRGGRGRNRGGRGFGGGANY